MNAKSTVIKFAVKLAIMFVVFWAVLKAISGESLSEVSEMPIWKAALVIAAIAAVLDLICDKLIPASSKIGQFMRY